MFAFYGPDIYFNEVTHNAFRAKRVNYFEAYDEATRINHAYDRLVGVGDQWISSNEKRKIYWTTSYQDAFMTLELNTDWGCLNAVDFVDNMLFHAYQFNSEKVNDFLWEHWIELRQSLRSLKVICQEHLYVDESDGEDFLIHEEAYSLAQGELYKCYMDCVMELRNLMGYSNNQNFDFSLPC